MAPASSQKGTGKKGAGAIARQRSRNTTPSSVPPPASLPPIETKQTEYLDLNYDSFRNITFEDIVDQNASNSGMPDTRNIDGIMTRLQRLSETLERRHNFCDRGMRLMVPILRTRIDEERTREEERLRQEAADDEERARKANKANKKKRKAADTLAPNDNNIERSSPLRDSNKPRKLSRDNDSVSSSLSPVAPATPGAMAIDLDEKAKAKAKAKAANDDDSSDSSSDDGAPPQRRVPQANTFGDDPSTFPDPTVYEVTKVDRKTMSDEQIKEATSVATYPKSDLADLIAGIPPDRDFSSAKPTNQISFSTFSTYIEPYFRPFTEEDLAFLRERGERVTPFAIPKRGKKSYLQIWAEEDNQMDIDEPEKPQPNAPRGSIEHMTDDIAETDKLSVGPLLSRLMQAMRPERRAVANEDGRPMINGEANGNSMDVSMNGVDGSDGAAPPVTQPNGQPAERELSPAAHMPESNTEAWKKASHPKLDYNQVDERIKQELRHIGFLPTPADDSEQPQTEEARADYDGAYDDEVAARLRLLQNRLREQMLINGARKEKLSELVRERMAFQEYQTILEDLDSQVQAAYLKRTRTMGKTKKKARPGASVPAATGVARPGIGDLTKTLMERRRRWIESIGTVFDGENLGKVPRANEPDSSIFKQAEMTELVKKETQRWDEDDDE
ncbi:Chromatin-remodeling complexes subunit NGG1 [Cytospora mali]|uniref:Chromatin-remodeling complexes subunit NGG1 n=1 Tax=Cytospora mali TaxID=578113 RepID=A0A194W2E8_CYTMA|nr:Chromatin-remodeling complexes subunit NGG1 [Valsa mali]